jgi:hypothetical protein
MTSASDNPGFEILQALPSNTGIVSGILQEAARWLVESGMPMWKDGELAPDRIAADVEAGLFYIVQAGAGAAGVFKMQPEDPLFWPDLPAGEAFYLHRIAVRRKFAGQGVTDAMTGYARRAVKIEGRRYLRLDCETSRPKLCAAYERLGFFKHSERQVGPYFVARYEQAVTPFSTDVRKRIELALTEIAGPNPSLWSLALEFKDEGMSQQEMYQIFDLFRAKHQNDADETKYNAILDTMDVIWGWCSPDNRIFAAD